MALWRKGYCRCRGGLGYRWRRFRRLPQNPVHRVQQPRHVHVEILPGIDLDCVAVGEIPQRLRQLRGLWHRGPQHQERDQRHAFAQHRLNLDPHRVRFIAEPVVRASRSQPARPDDGEHDVALVEHPVDVLPKIDAGRNVVDIAEDRIPAVMRHHAIKDPPADDAGILAAV
jgi:hypothetical protein